MGRKIIIAITGHNGVLGKKFRNIFKGYVFKKLNFDITNFNKVKNWINNNKFDILIHLAAIVPTNKVESNRSKALKVNFYGTKFIVDSLINKKDDFFFFYASTSHVYNFSKYKLRESSKIKPINYYAKTKLMSEKYIQNRMRKKSYAIGRIFSFTDPNQSDLYFIPSIFKKLKKKNKIYKFHDLNKKRDFISTKDIVTAINHICKKKLNGIYNIGSGKKYLLKNIVKQINKMFFKRKKIFFNDLKTNQDLIANNSKIKKKGWKPKENIQNILKNYYEKN